MQASFDPGIQKNAKSFAVVVWKDGAPVAWESFKPRVSEPLWDRFRDLTNQAFDWLDDCQREHCAFITKFALESFVDFHQPKFKNKSLGQLNAFRGYFACALNAFNSEWPEMSPELMDVCKETTRKETTDLVVKQLYNIGRNEHERDACYIGHLAGFGK